MSAINCELFQRNVFGSFPSLRYQNTDEGKLLRSLKVNVMPDTHAYFSINIKGF